MTPRLTSAHIHETRAEIQWAVAGVRGDEVWEPAQTEAVTFLLTAMLMRHTGRQVIAFFGGLPMDRVDALASTARRARIFAGGKLQSDYKNELGGIQLQCDVMVLQGRMTRSLQADGDVGYKLTEAEKLRVEAKVIAALEKQMREGEAPAEAAAE